MSAVATIPEPVSSYRWSMGEVLRATGGALLAPGHLEDSIQEVSIDSRALPPQSLFVALRGENHDGHDYVAASLARGAVAAVVDHSIEGVNPTQLVLVDDSLRALGDLAAWARRRRALDVVAITGSNGKTTTKDLIASICNAAESVGLLGPCRKTHGNFNNLIGLPLTLLAVRGESVAVLEMGMNRLGEIARLTEIAAPDYGVITNIGPAHLGGVGGTIEGVAQAKGELFAGMSPQAAIAVNIEDERVARVAKEFRGRRVTFGSGGEVQSRALADLGLDGLRFELKIGDRTAAVKLALVGAHNVTNALAAAAIGHLMGLPLDVIAKGLNAASVPPQRMQVVRLGNGIVLVDDAYNANPSSVEAALKSLRSMPGRSVVVLGDMRELGDESAHAHQVIGERAAALGVDELFLLGDEAGHVADGARAAGMSDSSIHIGSNHSAVAEAVQSRWQAGDCILVKGSHGMHMEEVVRILKEHGGSA